MNEVNLLDIGMKGFPFTWERGRGTDAHVEERLDRVLCTRGWWQLFPQVEVFNRGSNVVGLPKKMINDTLPDLPM